MGIKSWLADKRMKDPVEGTYELTACSSPPTGASASNCVMHGVVKGPGIAPVAVQHTSWAAPTAKWPSPGDTLPVRVDRSDPTRLTILWKQITSGADVGQQLAEQLAAAERGQPAGAGAGAQPGVDALRSLQGSGMFSQADLQKMQAGLGGAGMSVSDIQGMIANANGALADMLRLSGQTTGVMGDPSRPMPGTAGGGMSVEQSASALKDPASAGMVPARAKVLAVHEVEIPPGTPFAPPAGLFDLTLDVVLDSGQSYASRTRIGFGTPQTRDRVASVGAELPVLANPNSPDQVVIDTNHLG